MSTFQSWQPFNSMNQSPANMVYEVDTILPGQQTSMLMPMQLPIPPIKSGNQSPLQPGNGRMQIPSVTMELPIQTRMELPVQSRMELPMQSAMEPGSRKKQERSSEAEIARPEPSQEELLKSYKRDQKRKERQHNYYLKRKEKMEEAERLYQTITQLNVEIINLKRQLVEKDNIIREYQRQT